MALTEAAPDDLVSEISSADLEQVRKWNETVPPTVEACVHHLIEKQVHDRFLIRLSLRTDLYAIRWRRITVRGSVDVGLCC